MNGGKPILVIPNKKRRNSVREALVLLIAWSAAAVAILPVIFKWGAHPATNFRSRIVLCCAYLAAAAMAYCIYRSEKGRLVPHQAAILAFLVLLLSIVVNQIHHVDVDLSSSAFGYVSNLEWQQLVQVRVMQLSPTAIPHSYRFLPNAIVRWMEMAGARYDVGRDAYRLVFGVLLFWAIYRYARLYTSHIGAILALLLVAVIFPISFERYAGQLTDPASHLSFVLSFIFLETGQFWFLLTALLLGSLAKETVLAMAGYYVLFHRKDPHYLVHAALLCGGATLSFFGVRLAVLKGNLEYSRISGVGTSQIVENLHDRRNWAPLFLLTVGWLLVFLVVAWKETPRALKLQAMFLSPTLFFSSLAFSWLHETRNWMPLVFVLAVVAARYLAGQSSTAAPAHTATSPADPSTPAPSRHYSRTRVPAPWRNEHSGTVESKIEESAAVFAFMRHSFSPKKEARSRQCKEARV